MMSLESIRSLSADMSAKAARRKLQPAVIFSEETCGEDARKAPWLGDYDAYMPKGWRPAHSSLAQSIPERLRWKVFCYPERGWDVDGGIWLFIDKAGVGSPAEPALNIAELETVLKAVLSEAKAVGVDIGVSIAEEGQFQCHLALYERGERPKDEPGAGRSEFPSGELSIL